MKAATNPDLADEAKVLPMMNRESTVRTENAAPTNCAHFKGLEPSASDEKASKRFITGVERL